MACNNRAAFLAFMRDQRVHHWAEWWAAFSRRPRDQNKAGGRERKKEKKRGSREVSQGANPTWNASAGNVKGKKSKVPWLFVAPFVQIQIIGSISCTSKLFFFSPRSLEGGRSERKNTSHAEKLQLLKTYFSQPNSFLHICKKIKASLCAWP